MTEAVWLTARERVGRDRKKVASEKHEGPMRRWLDTQEAACLAMMLGAAS